MTQALGGLCTGTVTSDAAAAGTRRRHCGIYAMCDWLAGSDVQWLYGIDEDNAYYSHDHGYYLTGPDWTETSLAAGRDTPYTLSIPPDQLDAAELMRLADAL